MTYTPEQEVEEQEVELYCCEWCQEECEELNDAFGRGCRQLTSLCDDCYTESFQCALDSCNKLGDLSSGTNNGDYCSDQCYEESQAEKQQKQEELDQLRDAIQHLYDVGIINDDTDDYGNTTEDHIMENYRTGGGASRQLHSLLDNYELESILEHIENAHFRHTETDYDNIDKRGMSEEQITELRSQAHQGML